MKLFDNPTYRQGLADVAQDLPLDFAHRRTVLVTGATGLIGSAVVDLLLYLSDAVESGIKVIAAGRNTERLIARFGIHDNLQFANYADIVSGLFSGKADAAILAASPASPNLYAKDPDAVIKANTTDVRDILTFIYENGNPKVTYISSSEVYGDAIAPNGGFTEDQCGKLDETDPRSCYAIGKRKGEDICRQFAARGHHITIARPGHVYGPTATEEDCRVSSLWPREAAAGKNIVIKSDGAQLRSYVHCLDCATAIFYILFRGKPGEAYNISNRNSVITIKHLAEAIARTAHVQLVKQAATAAEQRAFNPMPNASLNAEKLEALGWTATMTHNSGIAETIFINQLEHLK